MLRFLVATTAAAAANVAVPRLEANDSVARDATPIEGRVPPEPERSVSIELDVNGVTHTVTVPAGLLENTTVSSEVLETQLSTLSDDPTWIGEGCASARCVTAVVLAELRRRTRPRPRKRRVLLADCVFPSDMARWRLVEVKAFMERYDTDILVPNRIDNYKGFEIPFAWTEDLNASHHLYEYDILIFNEFYNALQQFNDPIFDGVAWNGKFPADYLLRKKSRRGERDVVLQRYDAVYSIFKMVAAFFHGRYPASRHLAKFYPA